MSRTRIILCLRIGLLLALVLPASLASGSAWARGVAGIEAADPPSGPVQGAASTPAPVLVAQKTPAAPRAPLMDEAESASAAGDYDRAIALYKEALRRPATRERAQELIAEAYELKGDIEQARAEYRTYLILYPDGAGALRVRARLAGLERGEQRRGVAPAREAAGKVREPRVAWEAREVREGFFVGLGLTRVTIGGNFNGAWSVVGGGVTDVLPDLDPGVGFKLAAGYRFTRGSVEFNYSRSAHDGTWQGTEKPAIFDSYNVDGKAFVLKRVYGLQPLLALGTGYNVITVEEGSSNGVTLKDTKFKGWDLRAGGGVEIPLREDLALDLLALYRWGVYYAVEGITSGNVDGHLDGNGITSSVELKYIF